MKTKFVKKPSKLIGSCRTKNLSKEDDDYVGMETLQEDERKLLLQVNPIINSLVSTSQHTTDYV
jgi:hypothetical protein